MRSWIMSVTMTTVTARMAQTRRTRSSVSARIIVRFRREARAPSTLRNDTYQSFPCIACTRVHLINLKTGKVLGEEED